MELQLSTHFISQRLNWLRYNARAALRLGAAFVAPSMLLYISLWLLRHELVRVTALPYSQAIDAGLLRGFYFDGLVVMYAAIVAQLAWTLKIPKRIAWPIVAFLIWLATLSNVIHFKFFGTRLDWWIVTLHWRDLFVVQDSAAQIGVTWPIVLSAVVLIGAITLSAMPRLVGRPDPAPSDPPWWRLRPRRAVWLVILIGLSIIIWRLPRWTGGRKGTDILSDNPVRTWIQQATSSHTFAGAGKDWFDTWAEGFDRKDPSRPNRVLASFHEFIDPGPGSPTDAPKREVSVVPVISEEVGTWPLYRDFDADDAATTALRERLGLPATGPVNVMMLFLESTRAYELHHPTIGPLIFPGLREVLAKHSISWRQAYSSSFTAGQTVRGQFTGLCSMLPNMTGAATYIAHSTLRVRCIQQLLKENGYITTWMNSHEPDYHNKRPFELMHGTDLFFGGDEFEARGVTQKLGYWGLADEPFLLEVVNLVEELSGKGAPVFANVLTISVHHPYSLVDEGPVPNELVVATGRRAYYRKYLSRLRYEDKALTSFFKELFSRPIADNTVVVLTADHSAPVRPHDLSVHRQMEEVRFRVPFALITKNIPTPEVIETPVHQADIAPLIARIAGVRGKVTWVGRDPLAADSGTPWIYVRDKITMFRTSRRGCYPQEDRGMVECFDVTGRDPMYDVDLPSIAVDGELSSYFEAVVRANMHTIVMNLAQPSFGN
ncbi:MAG: hypothetical protein A2341_12355 [Deltaproteobacteria bacterium RIFOXYB12_FULL_58_9]|nr:MAG: hypothetical protein A2341_12355 [Deltaproteobacteria bacterium RIFOXYB12_FULL_58_9]